MEYELSPKANDDLTWHSDHPQLWRLLGGHWLRLKEWIWDHGGSRLYWRVGKRPPRSKWWIRWANPGFMPCEVCGYVWEWAENDGWFECEKTWTAFNGEYTQHWFEGTQTCPRCRCVWSYEDSD